MLYFIHCLECLFKSVGGWSHFLRWKTFPLPCARPLPLAAAKKKNKIIQMNEVLGICINISLEYLIIYGFLC